MILKDIGLNSSQLGPLTCPSTNQAAPGTSYSCTGNFTVKMTDFEQFWNLTFSANGTSPTLPSTSAALPAVVAAQSPAVLTMVAEPQLDMDLLATTCNQTVSSGKLACQGP